jgi:hypothetical protein
MVKTLLDITEKLDKYRNTGIVRGEDTGFKELDKLYSVKQGTYTIILAEPTHGKTEFIFEIIMNQTQYGKRSLICSPETGSVEEIVAELVHKYTGKTILKSSPFSLTDKEFYNAIAWLNEYFIVLDTDERAYSIPELFDIANEWDKSHPNQRIDIIVGEPYNELKHDMAEFGARQDLYIEFMMGEVRRRCKKEKRHFFLSIHPANTLPVTNKDGISYYPKPGPRQAAGGQALYRKSMTWITLWRPTKGILDTNGWEYKENEVHVYIDKAKPKGVAEKGKCVLYFDWRRNRYFESGDLYAFDHKKTDVDKFIMPLSSQYDKEPF